jgi:plasmid stability protein
MTQITVRNVDQELHQFLKEQANTKGMSVNRYIIQLLKDVGNQNEYTYQKEVHHDLDSLAGTWNDEMFAEFNQFYQEQRQIDEAMWS